MKKQIQIALGIAVITMAILVLVQWLLNQLGSMIYPVKNARLTSKYGYRTHPITGEYKFHNGIDLAAPTGTPVLSVASGTVVKTWSDSLNGNAISIKHDNGYTSGYAHLHTINVEPGQRVSKGQKIGEIGNTGASTGAHLHLTIRNRAGNTVDPLEYLS